MAAFKPLVEVDEGAALPKLLLKFLSGDELPRPADESHQDFERLPLQAHSSPMPGQLPRPFIEHKWTEEALPDWPYSGLSAHLGLTST
jgi:hypothetical protein